MVLRSQAIVASLCIASAVAHADSGAGEREAPRPIPLYSSLLLAARYSYTDSSDVRGALADSDLEIVAIDGRSRFAIGWPYALCTGLDATLGASSTGLAYGANLYLIGLVLPAPGIGSRMGRLSACGGVGLSGVRGSIPFGWEFAGEGAVELPVGPVDARVSAKAMLVANAEERRDGTEATGGFADEYSGAIELRLGSRRLLLGGDPVIGMMWQDVMGASFWGVFFGVGASGFSLR